MPVTSEGPGPFACVAAIGMAMQHNTPTRIDTETPSILTSRSARWVICCPKICPNNDTRMKKTGSEIELRKCNLISLPHPIINRLCSGFRKPKHNTTLQRGWFIPHTLMHNCDDHPPEFRDMKPLYFYSYRPTIPWECRAMVAMATWLPRHQSFFGMTSSDTIWSNLFLMSSTKPWENPRFLARREAGEKQYGLSLRKLHLFNQHVPLAYIVHCWFPQFCGWEFSLEPRVELVQSPRESV